MKFPLSDEEQKRLLKLREYRTIFNDHTSERYLTPEQWLDAILTYLSSLFDFERIFYHSVKFKDKLTEVVYAKGGNSRVEHNKINEKIKDMDLKERLEEFDTTSDQNLISRVKGFTTSLKDDDVMSSLVLGEEPIIVDPFKIAMNKGSNKSLVELYSDPNEGLVSVLLFPGKGTDGIFSVFGAANTYSNRDLTKLLLPDYIDDLKSAAGDIRNALQKQKLIEKVTSKKTRDRERDYHLRQLRMLSEDFSDGFGNPFMSFGGQVRRISEQLSGSSAITEKQKKNLEIMKEDLYRLERYFKNHTFLMKSIGSYSSQVIDLNNLLSEISSDLRRDYPQTSIKTHLRSNIPDIRGDPGIVRNMFLDVAKAIISIDGQNPFLLTTANKGYSKELEGLVSLCDLVVKCSIGSPIIEQLSDKDVKYIRQHPVISYNGKDKLINCLIRSCEIAKLHGGHLEVLPIEQTRKISEISFYFPVHS